MKTLFALLAFVLASHTGTTQPIDVLRYRFNITLNDANDTIYGRAEILLRIIEPRQEITLSLTSQNGKGMRVTQVQSPDNIAFRQEGEQLILTPGKKTAAGDTLNVSISYHGIPADGLIISKTKHGSRSFFADNWPNRGHNWLPCHDIPSDKAMVEFIVTAPQHYQVVANGIQVEETNIGKESKRTHWREDVPISTKVMVIGVADFAVSLSGMVDNCIPVYSWVYPEDRDKGFYDYAQAMEILPFFIKHVGPYGYKKLANVQSKTTFGGLENANTIFYSESSVGGKRKSESLLAHEIAHQWFGNMATEKTFAHLWLSEGFATYMTILYMENKCGRDTAIYLLEQDRREALAFGKSSTRPVVDQTQDYMELLNANSYQKGGWVLHMLRMELGDPVFWKAIRSYYATYAGKTAETGDLQKVFEKESGKDLSQFFTQWLFTPGNPQVTINWHFNELKKELTIRTTQIQNTPFHFPLEIAWIMPDGKKYSKTITMDGKEKSVSFPVTGKPSKLNIDPETKVLLDWKLEEK